MQEYSKEQIIADLFVVRAGLSTISQSTDLIKASENNCKAIEEDRAKEDKRITTLRKSIAYNENYKEGRLQDLEDIKNIDTRTPIIERFDKQIDYAKNEKIEKTHSSIGYYIGALVLLILAVLTISLVLAFSSDYMIPIYVLGIPLAIVGSILLAFAIKFTVRDKKKYKEAIAERDAKVKKLSEEKQKALENYQAKLSSAEQSIKEIDDKIASDKKELHKANKKLNELKLALEEAKKSCETLTLTEGEKSQATYTALKSGYAGLITESDWKNIDLVIFYLQSGRADTLKEALQQADQQRQADSIVKAIDSARNAICQEIRFGMQAIGLILVKGFEYLSNQIEIGSQKISRAIYHSAQMQGEATAELSSNISAQLEEQLAQTKELVSATELNNALQQKANQTSDTLIYDLRYNQQFWRK